MHARPRVLVITRNLPPLTGGMERLMLELVQGLSQRIDLDVIGPQGFRLTGPRRIWTAPFNILAFHVLALAHAARVRQGHYDLIVGGSILMAPLTRLVAWLAHCPFVLLAHGSDVLFPSRLYQNGFVRTGTGATLVFANSTYIKDQLLRRGYPADRIRVLLPAVTPVGPVARRDDGLRQRLALGNAPLLLGVGRVVASKGFAHFVSEVLPRVVAHHPGAHFVLIGDAPPSGPSDALAEVASAATAAGLTDRVHCVGAFPINSAALHEAFATADVHVFPALVPQGFGVVALEAAIQGTPTVAYDVGGVRDAVSDGVTGSLVPAGLPGEFAAAINRLLEGNIDRLKVREAASRSGDYAGRFLDSVRAVLSSSA